MSNKNTKFVALVDWYFHSFISIQVDFHIQFSGAVFGPHKKPIFGKKLWKLYDVYNEEIYFQLIFLLVSLQNSFHKLNRKSHFVDQFGIKRPNFNQSHSFGQFTRLKFYKNSCSTTKNLLQETSVGTLFIFLSPFSCFISNKKSLFFHALSY